MLREKRSTPTSFSLYLFFLSNQKKKCEGTNRLCRIAQGVNHILLPASPGFSSRARIRPAFRPLQGRRERGKKSKPGTRNHSECWRSKFFYTCSSLRRIVLHCAPIEAPITHTKCGNFCSMSILLVFVMKVSL